MLDLNSFKIYLIDFGISKLDLSFPRKISNNNNNNKIKFVGTPRFASVNSHQKNQQTPSDDIESLMYVLIYLYKKTLPWMNLNCSK